MLKKLIVASGLALCMLAVPGSAEEKGNQFRPKEIIGGKVCAPGDPACQSHNAPPGLQPPQRPSHQPPLLPGSSGEPDYKLPRTLHQPHVPGEPNGQPPNKPHKPHPPGDVNYPPHKPPHHPCLRGDHKCRPHGQPRWNDYSDFNEYYGYPDYYYNPPTYYSNNLVSCRRAQIILRNEGFRNIRLTKCGGTYHRFIARWRGANHIVKVKARGGDVTVGGRVK